MCHTGLVSEQACPLLSPRVTHIPNSHSGGAGIWEAPVGQERVGLVQENKAAFLYF